MFRVTIVNTFERAL